MMDIKYEYDLLKDYTDTANENIKHMTKYAKETGFYDECEAKRVELNKRMALMEQAIDLLKQAGYNPLGDEEDEI